MVDEHSPRLERHALLLAVAVGSLAGLAALVALTVLEIEAAGPLTLRPDRATVGTVLAGTLLVAGAVALPASILAGWQSAREEATRERRR